MKFSALSRILLIGSALLITAHRLPAPIQEVPESPTPVPGQSPSPQPTGQPKQGPCGGTWIGTLRGVPTIGDVEFTLVIAGAGNVVNEFSSAFGSRSWRATGDGTSIKWQDNWGCKWTLLPNGDGKTASVRCNCPLFNYPQAIFRKASL